MIKKKVSFATKKKKKKKKKKKEDFKIERKKKTQVFLIQNELIKQHCRS